MKPTTTAIFAMAALILPTASAAAPAPVDAKFVAMVSQGGMFEVQAGKLAVERAQAQDVQDFAAAEVHDHTLVGDKLKAASAHDGIEVSASANAEFQEKLDHLRGLTGPAFDNAYMMDMSDIHAKDGAAFAKEEMDGQDPGLKAFAGETHVIVERHIGAIHAARPPGS